jgi:hypothetical protein
MHGLSCQDPQRYPCVTAANDFQIEFPYLPEESYKAKKSLFMDSPNSVNLYEAVVPPSYKNLFFIGIVELPYAPPFSINHSPKAFQDSSLTIHNSGPLPPISEIQARWAVGILSKKFNLPTPEEMTRSIEQFQLNLAKNVSPLISSPPLPHSIPFHTNHQATNIPRLSFSSTSTPTDTQYPPTSSPTLTVSFPPYTQTPLSAASSVNFSPRILSVRLRCCGRCIWMLVRVGSFGFLGRGGRVMWRWHRF